MEYLNHRPLHEYMPENALLQVIVASMVWISLSANTHYATFPHPPYQYRGKGKNEING